MDIVFRADGGEKIGMGHIMRTLVLANKLRAGNNVKYACSSSKEFNMGVKKVKEEGIEVILVDNEDEIEKLNSIKADILIIDKYQINNEYFIELGRNFKLVYIDDNNELPLYSVDVILNQNIYAQELKYITRDNTQLLLGEKYFMLREEFLREKPIAINKVVKDILVTVGGSDNENITTDILNNIKKIKDINYHVIIGPAFKNKNCLKNSFKEYKNIKFYENANMVNLMRDMDLAVSACGGTVYELIYMGIPTVGIVVAENQKINSKYMSENKLIIPSSIEDIKENINKLNYDNRNKLSHRVKDTIDGLGIERILRCIKDLI